MNRRQQQSKGLLATYLSLLAGCTMINTHKQPPSDWPKLKTSIHKVGFWELQKICGSLGGGLITQNFGCAWIFFDKGTCEVYFAADDQESADLVIAHELMHCDGFDHLGSQALAQGWIEWKAHQRRMK